MTAGYLLTRTRDALIVLVGLTLVVFVLLHLGGDPISGLVPPDTPLEQREALRRALGLDEPLPVQYLSFLGRLARGDLGLSWRHRQPALDLVLSRVPATAALSGAAILAALALGIPAGLVAAVRRDRLADHLARLLALAGQTMPGFWLGLVLILLVAVRLHWLPASGSGSWRHLVLPAITLGAYPAAVIARLLRGSLIDALGQDYVRSARAKGLDELRVVGRHALPNALLPVITYVGLQLGFVLGGAIVVESVFAYPGMGLLTLQAVSVRDLPVVQAFVLIVGLAVVALNLLIDLLYTLLDPRVRYG